MTENWRYDDELDLDLLDFDIYQMVIVPDHGVDFATVYRTDTGSDPVGYAILKEGIWQEIDENLNIIKPMGIYARLFQQKLDTWHEYDAARNLDESQTWESEMIVHRGAINVIAKGKLILMTTTMLDPADDENSITTIVGMSNDEVNDLMQMLTQAKLKQLEWQVKYESSS